MGYIEDEDEFGLLHSAQEIVLNHKATSFSRLKHSSGRVDKGNFIFKFIDAQLWFLKLSCPLWDMVEEISMAGLITHISSWYQNYAPLDALRRKFLDILAQVFEELLKFAVDVNTHT